MENRPITVVWDHGKVELKSMAECVAFLNLSRTTISKLIDSGDPIKCNGVFVRIFEGSKRK